MNEHNFPFGPKSVDKSITLEITYYPSLDTYSFPELMGDIRDLIMEKYRDRYLRLNSIGWEYLEEPQSLEESTIE